MGFEMLYNVIRNKPEQIKSVVQMLISPVESQQKVSVNPNK